MASKAGLDHHEVARSVFTVAQTGNLCAQELVQMRDKLFVFKTTSIEEVLSKTTAPQTPKTSNKQDPRDIDKAQGEEDEEDEEDGEEEEQCPEEDEEQHEEEEFDTEEDAEAPTRKQQEPIGNAVENKGTKRRKQKTIDDVSANDLKSNIG